MIYDNPYGDRSMYRETIVKDGIAEYLGDGALVAKIVVPLLTTA